jgi:hypothetical protein
MPVNDLTDCFHTHSETMFPKSFARTLVAVFITAATLVACGGGVSDSDKPVTHTPETPATPQPPATGQPTTPVKRCAP